MNKKNIIIISIVSLIILTTFVTMFVTNYNKEIYYSCTFQTNDGSNLESDFFIKPHLKKVYNHSHIPISDKMVQWDKEQIDIVDDTDEFQWINITINRYNLKCHVAHSFIDKDGKKYDGTLSTGTCKEIKKRKF